jgi:membrane protein DedA with SNARE-associated domain
VVAAPGALASGGVANWEDAMTQDSMWMTLMTGVVIGLVAGYVAAWRLARKLEAHGIVLQAWDEDDWQQRQAKAMDRLRRQEVRS